MVARIAQFVQFGRASVAQNRPIGGALRAGHAPAQEEHPQRNQGFILFFLNSKIHFDGCRW